MSGGSMKGMRGAVLAATVLLAACGGGVRYRPVSDVPVKIGKPYNVRGVTYVPAADPTYDYLGYASWYGSESGNQTANGERFRPKAVTAAHTTLPLPSYVEVTSLDTGRTILVRINDRGPFSGKGRIIDLSRGGAQQLGMHLQGVAPVRIRIANPSEKDRKKLREGQEAPERPRVPESVLAKWRAQLAAGQ
ncbi:MAG: septal ring lytic transglycosylase RlpA family protein [Sphingobium sp.]